MRENRGYSGEKRRLFKDPDRAKICGVCAGVAEYFGFEVWVVRIIAVSALLLGSGAIVLAYLVLCFVLDPKPGSQGNKGCFGRERRRHRDENNYEKAESKPYRSSVKDVWRSGTAPKDALTRVENKFSDVEKKLQKLESFVTSKQFELAREFNKMAK
ncbi:envelope stress response membrane protein PspC [Aliikangiella coralliicola]|uniref:Envelope stress response membrane protein PspC n=1 Tax=Aliikangiella coralliicola TaxID=2592383 RepID=A0A545UAX2_9GAMM|nr:envelope stress response membrane protein PspC [Aliikangiella coralliicola]TQV86607.1 envelope stress response membrane protein PspC [Aliikangiella coralliicola]